MSSPSNIQRIGASPIFPLYVRRTSSHPLSPRDHEINEGSANEAGYPIPFLYVGVLWVLLSLSPRVLQRDDLCIMIGHVERSLPIRPIRRYPYTSNEIASPVVAEYILDRRRMPRISRGNSGSAKLARLGHGGYVHNVVRGLLGYIPVAASARHPLSPHSRRPCTRPSSKPWSPSFRSIFRG